jgi:hypothetical protein
MRRHYYLSDDLDLLDQIEDELEHRGIVRPQIHVLSKDDGGVETHRHLHNIESILKQDIVHGTLLGAMLGLIAAGLVVAIGHLSGLPETYSWIPFYFLAVVMFGFVTWSGGFYGIQMPHKSFRRFQKDLDAGKHVFIVDVDPTQEDVIRQMEYEHPELKASGIGHATPRWVVMGQQTFKDITTTTFP